jgi:hypothetical protein
MSTTSITCNGLIFHVTQPYEEGQEIKANEAAALNQLRCENLRNNFAPTVAKAKTNYDVEDANELPDEVKAELQEAFEQADEEYEFYKHTRSTRLPKDPVAAEAMNMARDLVKDMLAKQGYSIAGKENGIGKERYNSLVQSILDHEVHGKNLREKAKLMVDLANQAKHDIDIEFENIDDDVDL